MTLTAEQVAEHLHMTPRTVRDMCHDGRLVASKVGKRWLITEQAVQDYLEQTSNREKRPARRRRRRVA